MAGPTQKELCFVLKTIPFKERDMIAVLLSEHKGKLTAIARNGRQSKRFGGSLDFFTASDFDLDTQSFKMSEFGEEHLVRMNSASAKHSFERLSKSITKLSCASCLNELLLRVIPAHKAAPELFKLYSNTLTAIDELPENQSVAILNGFILKLTQWLGVQPAMTRCKTCEKTLNEIQHEEVYPQFQSGGWTCLDCTRIEERKLNRPLLSKTLILDAYHALLHPIRKIEWQATEQDHFVLLEFLEQHLIYFVPGLDRVQLSSIKFLKSIQLPD